VEGLSVSAPPCIDAGEQHPRIIPGRHRDDCPSQQPAPVVPKGQHVEVTITVCTGCLPCTRRHCDVCGRRHVRVDFTCPTCLAEIREHMARIVELCGAPLLEQALLGTTDPIESEAVALLGPVAHQEAWYHRRESALAGRIPADFLEVARDERHPLFVLGTWELAWREWLDHDTDARVTIGGAVRYLGSQLAYMASQPDVPLDQLHGDLKGCVGYLEGVLSAGDQRPATCPKCGGKLVLVHDKKHEDQGWDDARVVEGEKAEKYDDRWVCQAKDCGQEWTDAAYRAKILAVREAKATALPASAIQRVHGVLEATVRKWAQRGLVDKRGRDADGRLLYDVAQVLAQRDGVDDTPEATG
jgi:hypothetical protein